MVAGLVSMTVLTPGPASLIQVDVHLCSPVWGTVPSMPRIFMEQDLCWWGHQDWAFLLSPHLLKLTTYFLICKNANIKKMLFYLK